jgi:hypothetical protein
LHHGHHVANFNMHHHNQMCQHHHACHPRSVSCDHSNSSQNQIINFHNHIGMGMHSIVGLPPSQQGVKSQGQRPGGRGPVQRRHRGVSGSPSGAA